MNDVDSSLLSLKQGIKAGFIKASANYVNIPGIALSGLGIKRCVYIGAGSFLKGHLWLHCFHFKVLDIYWGTLGLRHGEM